MQYLHNYREEMAVVKAMHEASVSAMDDRDLSTQVYVVNGSAIKAVNAMAIMHLHRNA